MKLKKRRVMYDGGLVGAAVEGSLEVKKSELTQVWNLLSRKGGRTERGGVEVTVSAESSMVVALRPHYHQRDKWYLNFSGNALTFLRGSNVYGYAEADVLITVAFIQAMTAIGEFPRRLIRAVKAGDVNVHSLEFAAYTNEVEDKQQLINDWQHVYGTAYSNSEGVETSTLCELLGLKYVKKHVDHRSSLCFRIMTPDGREEEAMLMAYDKAEEMRADGVLKVPKDIERRLRLDLHLHNGWFRKHRAGGKAIRTLSDVAAYVEEHHAGKWHRFIASEMNKMVDRTCMFEVWSFPFEKGLAGNYEYPGKGRHTKLITPKVYEVLALARLNCRVTDLARVLAANGKHAMMTKQQTKNPHPYEIKIDLSPIK